MNDSSATVLHLILTARAEAWAQCSLVRQPGDMVLFLDEGVLRFDDAGWSGSGLMYSRADLDARGLLQAAKSVSLPLFDDADFPGLLSRHAHCLSWK